MMKLPPWWGTLSHVVNLAMAYKLVLSVDSDREKDDRSVGYRTFPPVAIAICGFLLIGVAILGRILPDQERLLEGLITSVGFIGGGAVLKYRGEAFGTAAAASLWGTGAPGAAVGDDLYHIWVVLSLTTFLTLHFTHPLKRASRYPAELVRIASGSWSVPLQAPWQVAAHILYVADQRPEKLILFGIMVMIASVVGAAQWLG